MIDFRKAFDLVDHRTLLKKLKIYKCNKQSVTYKCLSHICNSIAKMGTALFITTIFTQQYLTQRVQVKIMLGLCTFKVGNHSSSASELSPCTGANPVPCLKLVKTPSDCTN